MAIELKCQCGATCSADEAQAGQTVKCAACGRDVPVPTDDGFEQVVEMEIEAAETATRAAEAEGEKPSIHEAVRDQLYGKVDHDDMIFQITGRRPGETTPAPAAAAAAAPRPEDKVDADVAAAAAQAPAPTEGRRRTMTRLDYARHHYGFKKIFWPIGLGIGGLLLAMAVWGFWPRGFQTFDDIPTLEEMAKREAPDIEHPVLHHEFTHDYLIEQGAAISYGKDNTLFYEKGGFQLPAVQVDEWATAHRGIEEQVGTQHMLWLFGACVSSPAAC